MKKIVLAVTGIALVGAGLWLAREVTQTAVTTTTASPATSRAAAAASATPTHVPVPAPAAEPAVVSGPITDQQMIEVEVTSLRASTIAAATPCYRDRPADRRPAEVPV